MWRFIIPHFVIIKTDWRTFGKVQEYHRVIKAENTFLVDRGLVSVWQEMIQVLFVQDTRSRSLTLAVWDSGVWRTINLKCCLFWDSAICYLIHNMCSLRPARYKAFTIAHQGRRNNIHPVVSGESHRQTGSLHCTLINLLDIKLFVCLLLLYWWCW